MPETSSMSEDNNGTTQLSLQILAFSFSAQAYLDLNTKIFYMRTFSSGIRTMNEILRDHNQLRSPRLFFLYYKLNEQGTTPHQNGC